MNDCEDMCEQIIYKKNSIWDILYFVDGFSFTLAAGSLIAISSEVLTELFSTF